MSALEKCLGGVGWVGVGARSACETMADKLWHRGVGWKEFHGNVSCRIGDRSGVNFEVTSGRRTTLLV